MSMNRVRSSAAASSGRSALAIAAMVAVLLAGLGGCMTVTVTYNLEGSSQINNSPISQAKPVDASPYLSTTGKDIGTAINAAMGGVDIGSIQSAIKDLKAKIDELKSAQGGSLLK